MKKLFTAVLIIALIFSCAVYASCDYILDLIFGPSTPPEGEEPAHVHSLELKTLDNSVCSGRESAEYWKCTECGKCYSDEEGKTELAGFDENSGHSFVTDKNEQGHQQVCSLCSEPNGERLPHQSDKWRYDRNVHYKSCDVCGYKYNRNEHEMQDSICNVCDYSVDYKTICNSRYGYEYLGTLDNGDNLQAFYDEIDLQVTAAHDDAQYVFVIVLSGADKYYTLPQLALNGITDDQAAEVISTYRNDNPLYYWLTNQVSYASVNGKVTSVSLHVNSLFTDGSYRLDYNEKLYDAIRGYTDVLADETDAYHKALALHDALTDNVDYAYESDGETPIKEQWAHTVEGALLKNFAVCESYAKAYQLLLNVCNVPNIYVTGSSRGVGHAWNMVQLANEWYWYDVTWDDQPNMPGGVIYDYACKTDEQFLQDHTIGDGQTGLNYLYGLPQRASAEYDNANAYEIGERFTDNNLTFVVCGYNAVSLIGVKASGKVTVPSAVTVNGRAYSVEQIGSDAFDGSIFASAVEIPESVNIIFNESFVYAKISEAIFADVNGWSRYPLNGKEPVYEVLLADDIANAEKAAVMLKEIFRNESGGNNTYVWIKSRRADAQE